MLCIELFILQTEKSKYVADLGCVTFCYLLQNKRAIEIFSYLLALHF